MARPNHSTSFKSAQGKTIVVTPRDLGLDLNASDEEKAAAKQEFQRIRAQAMDGDDAAREYVANVIDATKNRAKPAQSLAITKQESAAIESVKQSPPEGVSNSRWGRLIDKMESVNQKANRLDAEDMAIAATAYVKAGGKPSEAVIESLPVSTPSRRLVVREILAEVERLNKEDKVLTSQSFDSTDRMVETSMKVRALKAVEKSQQKGKGIAGSGSKKKALPSQSTTQTEQMDRFSLRRQTNEQVKNSTFNRKLQRGDLKGAIEESKMLADDSKKKARRAKFEAERRNQEVQNLAQSTLKKYPTL